VYQGIKTTTLDKNPIYKGSLLPNTMDKGQPKYISRYTILGKSYRLANIEWDLGRRYGLRSKSCIVKRLDTI